MPLTSELWINIFKGFPKRYCESKLVKVFQNYIFIVSNEKIWHFFLQIWGFYKLNFCSKIDVYLDSDVPQKHTIPHWKAYKVSILPNKLKMWKNSSKSRWRHKCSCNFFCNTLYHLAILGLKTSYTSGKATSIGI